MPKNRLRITRKSSYSRKFGTTRKSPPAEVSILYHIRKVLSSIFYNLIYNISIFFTEGNFAFRLFRPNIVCREFLTAVTECTQHTSPRMHISHSRRGNFIIRFNLLSHYTPSDSPTNRIFAPSDANLSTKSQ